MKKQQVQGKGGRRVVEEPRRVHWNFRAYKLRPARGQMHVRPVPNASIGG